jgi:hypothetical protein
LAVTTVRASCLARVRISLSIKQNHSIARVSYLVVAAQTANERDQGSG